MAPMAMFSTNLIRSLLTAGALALCGMGLSGCLLPEENLSPEFGRSLHQHLAAQIADPDAVYGPQPPADGAHSALATDRYQKGQVIQPVPAKASDIPVQTAPAPAPGPQ